MFSCFIDFRKTFDSITRDLLFNKRLKIGISVKFFNSLKTLYQNDNCTVKLSNGLTNVFVANQGVTQGCILSPLLFNIFLADLPDYLNTSECRPLQMDDSTPIDCNIWEDDIVILSETEEGLQCMLDNLTLYALENEMKINVDKTKSMIFNKS